MKPIRSGQNVKPRRVVVLTFTREQDGCFLFFIEWKAVPPSCLGNILFDLFVEILRAEMARNIFISIRPVSTGRILKAEKP